MTSPGHVTSLRSCPIDSLWPLSIGCRLSIHIYYKKKWWRHQRLLGDDVINDVIRPISTIREYHTDEHCVKISSNSDKNCRRRSIIKKNDDVTIMRSSGHVTSSGSCPIDSTWSLSYGPSIGTIPLSGFISEIFTAKVPTKIITWWRHQWRHKARMNYPWGMYTHTIHWNIVLKYRPIPTTNAGEEAF